jgi:hypothetical protein
MPSHPRRPGQASNASADPGPIRRGRHYLANGSTAFAQQFKPVVMGPGVRRDDLVFAARDVCYSGAAPIGGPPGGRCKNVIVA